MISCNFFEDHGPVSQNKRENGQYRVHYVGAILPTLCLWMQGHYGFAFWRSRQALDSSLLDMAAF